MRPLRSFLFFLIFLACFSGLHYIIPVSQLFPSIFEFVPHSLISDLSSGHKIPAAPGSPLITDSIKVIAADTVALVPPDTISSLDSVSSNSRNLSSDPFQVFLDTLRCSKRKSRIMYYGDSQIEGDRITSYLRTTLRSTYGGTGPGLFLPLMPEMYTKSIWVRSSPNWKRYNYLSYKTGEISHREFGPLMVICRYLPDGQKNSTPEKAFIKIRPSNVADSASSKYDILRIFYGNTNDTVTVKVETNKHEIFADTLKKVRGFNEISCHLNEAHEVQIEFKGKVSPDIYGISIEGEKGVVVDNIPQRGSAGLVFTMVDRKNLSESFEKLSPDLFIMHFGLNIVKNVKDDYSGYQKGLERQFSLLKELSPSTPVLVIGVTDMAVKEGDSIKSYQNIPAIIDAQKQAAINEGATFWDSYRAMGGKSSIIRWAAKKPSLAQKDYVHLTYPGADTLSRMLTEALFSINATDTNNYVSNILKTDTVLPVKPVPVVETRLAAEVKSRFDSLIALLLKYDPDEPLIFSVPAFWIFFLLVLAGYSLLYRKLFLRNAYLFLVSLFFYYKSGGLFLFLLIFVTLIDFTCGRLIHHSRTKFFRRFFILFSIISNLGLLAYFKYTGFFADTINDLLGTDYRVYDFLAAFSNTHLYTSFNFSNIILPVGISFFTFQSLSYTFDVYRRKMEPVKNVIDFGFYVSFFPQLVAGPIVRASEFIPQLYSGFHLTKREFSHALFLISKGLVKKIIISDFIAINFIDRVFDAPDAFSGFENLMAVYGYGLQIYCDFSGYTDIAIGLGLILGFRLPINFNSPYKALNISDFWKRWHISLSRWLKDYLYIPLGGNRKGKIRTGINLMLTMLLGGLWHGAALRFIIWGGLHGIGLVFSKIWDSIFGNRFIKFMAGRALSVFLTFNFISFCWIFFRAPDMERVGTILRQITESFSPTSYITVIVAYSGVFILIFAGYLIHFLPESLKESYRGLFIRTPLAVQMIIIMMIAIILFQMRTTDVIPFIYFRF